MRILSRPFLHRQCRFRGYLVERLEARHLLAASLFQDLNPTTASSSIYDKEPLGGSDLVIWTERGLHASDGTAAGTTLLKPAGWYGAADRGVHLTRVGDRVYFVTSDHQSAPRALWRTDGTVAGTVKLLQPSGDFSSLTEANGALYYGIQNAQNGSVSQLFKLDPATETPVLLHQFASYRAPAAMTWYGGRLYYSVGTPEVAGGTGEHGLWSSDGTPGGARLVKAMYSANGEAPINAITVSGGLMYFGASERDLGEEPWRSDGTAAGTFKIRELSSGLSSSTPRYFVGLDATTTLFLANGELYRTQGTSATTARVASTAYNFRELARAGSAVYLTATHDSSGTELWKTDGTAAGTVLVTDLVPGAAGSFPQELHALGQRLLFIADDPARGREVWTSDGTAAGTTRLTDGPPDFGPTRFVTFGSRAVFNATDPIAGQEPHVTDGTAAGTRLLRDLNTTPNSSEPRYRFSLGGNYYFTAGTADGRGWFRSDGTTVAPVPAPATSIGNSSQVHSTTWNGAGYFFAEGFYRLDAAGVTTLSGTAGAPHTDPYFTPYNGQLFFQAFAQARNRFVLFKTDGTPGGTSDAFGMDLYYSASGIVAGGGSLYFAGTPDRPGGRPTLWKSDGTPAGTTPIPTSQPNSPYSFDNLTWFQGALYFIRTEYTGGREISALYRTDGTAAPTRVKEFADENIPQRLLVSGGRMLFTAAGTGVGYELWASDGTSEGTQLLKDIYPGADSSWPQFMAAADGKAYFAATRLFRGRQPWVTDGTAAGTMMLAEVHPLGDSLPFQPAAGSFAVAGGTLFFNAAVSATAKELWRSDGTPAGTRQVTRLNSGPTDPGPLGIAAAGADSVLFAATDPVHGRELWRANVTLPPPVTVTGGFDVSAGQRVQLTFSRTVNPPLPQDLVLTRLADGGRVAIAGAWLSYDPAASRLTIAPSPPLADGNYRLLVPAASVSDADGVTLAGDFTIDFFVLAGDINRDRAVNGSDFAILAANFGRSGMTYGQGDLNGDGSVNGSDFAILAGNFGKTVSAPAAPAAPVQLASSSPPQIVASGAAVRAASTAEVQKGRSRSPRRSIASPVRLRRSHS